jgi:hypothetical protein
MSVYLYHVQYFGGPCDGCIAIGTCQRGEDTWSVPASAMEGRAGSSDPSTVNGYRAVYKLSRTCHLIDLGMPTIRYEYEFIGWKIAAPVTSRVRAGWVTFLKNQLKHLFQRSLWFPLPEGRPKRPGQAERLTDLPGSGSRNELKVVGAVGSNGNR